MPNRKIHTYVCMCTELNLSLFECTARGNKNMGYFLQKDNRTKFVTGSFAFGFGFHHPWPHSTYTHTYGGLYRTLSEHTVPWPGYNHVASAHAVSHRDIVTVYMSRHGTDKVFLKMFHIYMHTCAHPILISFSCVQL